MVILYYYNIRAFEKFVAFPYTDYNLDLIVVSTSFGCLKKNF